MCLKLDMDMSTKRMNSDKMSNYKRIELKSQREKRSPIKNGLFMQTYSFKIKKKGMPLLFPESIIYNI